MIKNYTITGKTDGLGCQLNAVFSAIAFCEHDPDYIYVHTPFNRVSHGWESPERVKQINEFVGIPNGRGPEVEIHTKQKYGNKQVFNDRRPSRWYDEKTLRKLRNWYWSTPKPPPCEQDIVIHIRRGDTNSPERIAMRGEDCDPNGWDAKQRYDKNDFYNDKLPKILSFHPEDYTIAIHTETHLGCKDDPMDEFISIMDGWPQSLKDRITWKIAKDWEADQEYNLLVALHEMVTAKVFIQSRSGLSYVAGILNKNEVWFFSKKGSGRGQRYPLDHWRLLEGWGSKTPDGTIYSDFCKDLEEGKYD